MLLEQDLYKVGESDTFKANGVTYTVERVETGWKLTEKWPTATQISLFANLNVLFRRGIFQARQISY